MVLFTIPRNKVIFVDVKSFPLKQYEHFLRFYIFLCQSVRSNNNRLVSIVYSSFLLLISHFQSQYTKNIPGIDCNEGKASRLNLAAFSLTPIEPTKIKKMYNVGQISYNINVDRKITRICNLFFIFDEKPTQKLMVYGVLRLCVDTRQTFIVILKSQGFAYK